MISACVVRLSKYGAWLVLAWTVLLPAVVAGEPQSPVAVGQRRELLLDDSLIEEQRGVTLKLHSPQPQEVVMAFDADWEGPRTTYVRLFQDGGIYRMYYRGQSEVAAKSRVNLNYATSAAGSIRMEVQDAEGKPLAGFALEDSPELFGDHSDGSVEWSKESDVTQWIKQPIRLRFVMKDADVYSFQFR